MSAPATGCSSDGDERVKADEGALEAASIAAPAMAAIAPPDKMRRSMVFSKFPTLPRL
jgi:hypothetical protein